MRNLIKRIARRILRQELFNQEQERLRLAKENVELLKDKREDCVSENSKLKLELQEITKIRYVIPDFIICGILSILPNPNVYAAGIKGLPKLSKMRENKYQYQYKYPDGSVKVANFRFLFLGDNGIEVELCDLGSTIFIPLIKVDRKSITYGKIQTEVTTYAWNINNLGISVIDGKSFNDIYSFLTAQKECLGYFE